jgi:hypothetical protein
MSSCKLRIFILAAMPILGGIQQAAHGQDVNVSRTNVNGGFRPLPVPVPGYGGGGGWGYSQPPIGGYLSGTADLINAQGQWFNDVQQAAITKEQSKQAMIDTRRKNFDQWLYERENTPTFEDDRERQYIESVRRARGDPPINEIWSGLAMNQLLLDIQRMNVPRGQVPPVPLDPDIIRNLNFTSGASQGSIGLVRDGGQLHWPLVLRRAPFAEARRQMDTAAAAAYRQAQQGEVDAATLDDMNAAVRAIDAAVRENIDSITPAEYSSAKQYLRQIRGTISALQDPNVAKHFSNNWVTSVTSVGDLVSEMTRRGLRFAPVVQGGEAAYQAAYTGLVSYNTSLASLSGMAPGTRSLNTNGRPR